MHLHPSSHQKDGQAGSHPLVETVDSVNLGAAAPPKGSNTVNRYSQSVRDVYTRTSEIGLPSEVTHTGGAVQVALNSIPQFPVSL